MLFLCLQEWLDANVKKQSEAKPSDNPVLVVKDIEVKQGKLDRELLYLLNKAKYYVPKPKVNETGTNHVFFTVFSCGNVYYTVYKVDLTLLSLWIKS